MKDRPKKYCPLCGERVRHSTRRCPNCGQRILTARDLIVYILLAVAVVAVIFLWLDYQNIEIFK
jgi:predicted amidophosphoribosyltransferase